MTSAIILLIASIAVLSAVGFIIVKVVSIEKTIRFVAENMDPSAAFKTLLDRENQKLVESNAELVRLIHQIEEMAENDLLDVQAFVDDAKKQAYLIAVKNAEQNVIFAESKLASCQEAIAGIQESLILARQKAYHFKVLEYEGILESLIQDEEILQERVQRTHQFLETLISATQTKATSN